MNTFCPLPNWPRELLLVIRLSFWFACFWTVIGTLWRPPLASLGLLPIFLVLLIIVEWLTRRLNPKHSPADGNLSISETANALPHQRITRIKTAEGLDRFEGTFLAEFPPGTTMTTVHVAFCPAFEHTPTIEILPAGEISADKAEVNFRIVQSKPYGMRIDVKRNNVCAESDAGQVRFTIVAVGESPG